MSVVQDDLANVDVASPKVYAEGVPHETLATLRKHDPVHWHPEPDGPGFWAVTRYEDVKAVGRDPGTFSSVPTIMIPDNAGALDAGDHQMMITMDPPDHTGYRKLVSSRAPTEFNPGERSDVSWISTESGDRLNTVILARGMNDRQFALNPVVTLNHCYDIPPVGRSLWRKFVKDGGTKGTKA